MNERLGGRFAGTADHSGPRANNQEVLRNQPSLVSATFSHKKLKWISIEKHTEIAAGSKYPIALVKLLSDRDQSVRSGGDGIDCLGVSGMDHERFNLGSRGRRRKHRRTIGS